MPQPTDRTFIQIDVPTLLDNLACIKNMSRGKKVFAVVKANCYGHGYGIIPHIVPFVDGLGVATVEEGCRIRQIDCNIPILVLGYVSAEDIPSIIQYNLSVGITSLAHANALNNAMYAFPHKQLKAHIKINTGMNRLGIDYCNLSEADRLLDLENIDYIGVFSHYAESRKEDATFHATQTARFLSMTEYLTKKKDFLYIHMANSAALGEDIGNTVRVGYAMYGYAPGLTPILSWKAKVVQLHYVVPPEGVGYGLTFRPQEKRKIATVSVGYGDGYPRSLSNTGKVLFGSGEYPIVGRVCMDMLNIDASGSDMSMGDYVTLIGKDSCGKNNVSAEDLGFGYEILCGIASRVPRIYSL